MTIVCLATWLPIVSSSVAGAEEPRFIAVGTGGATGVYYPAGGAICRLLNNERQSHGLRCSVETTGGSIQNIERLREGSLDFGFAQADWQFHAFQGSSEFASAGPFGDLRSVFSIHPELMTFVARTDAGIRSLNDFKGKRFNIGNVGSGARGTWDVIEAALGWNEGQFEAIFDFKPSEVAQALCNDEIEGYVWPVGHPSALIRETLATCDAVLVPAVEPEIDQLVAEHSYFNKAVISQGFYDIEAPVETFGVAATLVTRAQVPDDVVYQLVKSVFDNLDTFKAQHPAFANLEPEQMISAGLSAPLHPGALKYYRERGWK
ncbi:MAG: TAXI family TRAP transporter solute-binding subunit [Rhodobacteraceae bacterium]|nr:TAXI family TRAP transporter solute-binding subunit [Paracoccaceae bacterium]